MPFFQHGAELRAEGFARVTERLVAHRIEDVLLLHVVLLHQHQQRFGGAGVTVGIAGLAAFPWQTMVGGLLPLAVGVALGNLDRELREFFGRAAPVMIPFFAFALGTTLDLHRVAQAGLLGAGLGVCVVLVSGTILFLLDRAVGGNGTAGLAAASTAGNAAAVPALVAAANPVYAEAAASATVLVAASVIVTALLAPLVTVWWATKNKA